MRLTLIREKKAKSVSEMDRPSVSIPSSAADVDRLFDRGMKLMDAHRDDDALLNPSDG
jgi:hypothetical protein